MKKIFLSVLLTAITILLVLGLSSCNDEECAHEWGEWSISSPSTCKETGEKIRKCLNCDETQSAIIDVSYHKYDTDNLVWTWNGYESATVSAYCCTDNTHKKEFNANITDEVTLAASCTTAGTKTYTASVTINAVTYTAEPSPVGRCNILLNLKLS